MAITLLSVVGNPDTDVLTVTGETDDAEPRTLTATGWVSAITNYFPPEVYGVDGDRDPAFEPRRMSKDEVRAYALGLLEAVAAQEVAPEPTEVSFL